MSKHSKGPWQMSKPQIHGGGLSVDIDSPRSGRYALATVVWQMEDDKFYDKPSEECIANARLIAAAPDLLAALEGLFAVLEDAHIPGVKGSPIEAARAAISEAKGLPQ